MDHLRPELAIHPTNQPSAWFRTSPVWAWRAIPPQYGMCATMAPTRSQPTRGLLRLAADAAWKGCRVELKIRYRRYRALFDNVWQQLPADDGTEIEEVLLFVTDKLVDFRGGQRNANVYGMAARTPGGLKVLLRHKFLLTLDDRFVMGVIAHELAHVLCRHPLDGVLWTATPKEAFLWAEAEANALAQAWGFSPPSLLTGHWATSEHYAMIARVGMDFTPPRLTAPPVSRASPRKAAVTGQAPHNERVTQACFDFLERPASVA